MAQVLVAIGAMIFVALGTLHGLLALRDIAHPTAFSLGLVVFGGSVLGMGLQYFDLFAGSLLFQTVVLLVAACYFLLSVRFWFWGPALGSGSALLCFLAGVLMIWGRAAA